MKNYIGIGNADKKQFSQLQYNTVGCKYLIFWNNLSWINNPWQVVPRPGPEVIKLFSCSAQLRLKFIVLINVKMPTIVGILTFISKINYRLL